MKRMSFPSSMIFCVTVLISSCNPPLPPKELPLEEPDTAHSFIHATINGEEWNVETQRALSYGTGGVILAGVIESLHKIDPQDTYFSIKVQRAYNLDTMTITKGWDNNNTEILRTWYQQNLSLYFKSPAKITTPIVIKTVRTFIWSTYKMREQYLPGYMGKMTLYALKENNTYKTMSYSAYSNDNDNAILQASLLLAQYDTVKHRVSGRFLCTIQNNQTGQILDIQDGRFDNVYLQRFGK